jgi:type IV pilus assembly protein PilM
MPLTTAPVVGLDIGTSAVRAALVARTRSGWSLLRFGQVALPVGAVSGGEVRDEGAVAGAVEQLWKRARFKTKRVIVGVSNQRVVVRQVDLPYLDEKDLRSSIRFQVADHVPMPIEDAEIDYWTLDDYTSETGEHMLRLLLVAAASDMVQSFVGAASSAGLQPVGVDLSAFAISRAVSAAARGEVGAAGAEAVVDVGAGTTNIVVHRGGEPRFVRILMIGGDDATTAIGRETDVDYDEAEATKLDLARGVGSPAARGVLQEQVQTLITEIEGSLDYYLTQDEGDPITSVIVTGGGSLAPGLFDGLQEVLPGEVRRATAFDDVDASKSGLTQEQLAQVEQVAAAAVGLAMGGAAK